MAIIHSHSVDGASGSIGLVTYKYLQGRIIGSQKVGARSSATRAAMRATDSSIIFAFITRFARVYKTQIKGSFSPTNYGSAINAFVRINYQVFKAALAWGRANNTMLVTLPSISWAAVDSSTMIQGVDAVALMNAYTVAVDSHLVSIALAGADYVYVAMGATFSNGVVPLAPLVTSLTLTSTISGNSTVASKVTITGANLDDSEVLIKAAGVALAGTWNAAHTVLTLTTNYTFSTNVTFAAYNGAQSLYSVQINGYVTPGGGEGE